MKSIKNKLLVICGPTATGKTDLGISLAQRLDGEIISADSRQVYKGMDIGTGKQYSDFVTIWGYDLVEPNEEFSVAHFHNFATKKIAEIQSRNKLPIIVGGTGLYIKSVLTPFETTSVPKNEKLRSELSEQKVDDLFAKLLKLDPNRANAMNQSDKNNPARLIRAIEVATSSSRKTPAPTTYDSLVIGLTASLEILYSRVDNAVVRRLKAGFQKEVQSLLDNRINPDTQSMTATGYKQMVEFLQNKISMKETIALWATAEKQYVKRQLTWFKKQENIHWFDISKPNFRTNVEKLVNAWNNTV